MYDPSKWVEKLNLEIKRTFVSLPSLKIKKIRIAGAGLVLDEVIESLKKYLPDEEIIDCKNSMYKTKDNVRENTTLASQSLAVTLGSALKGFNLNKLNIDFRKGEFALKDAFEVMKAPLSVAVVLLMVLFFAIFIFFYKNKQDLDKLTDALHEDIKHIFEDTYKIGNKQHKKFPSDENKISAIESAYLILKKDFTTVSNFGSNRGLPEVRSVLKVWREIFKKIDLVGRENPAKKNEYGQDAPSRSDPKVPDPKYNQRFKLEFSLRSIIIDNNIKRERFVLEGRCKDNTAIVNLRNLLNREKELFNKVIERVSEITDTETIKRDKIYDTRPTFKIEGEIVPPPSMVKTKKK
ncbi:MAG: hypothetical protein K8S87_09575 [Planctomycetes bacterium]|nr:hypothetical protein [Planctomycetota bacterium]